MTDAREIDCRLCIHFIPEDDWYVARCEKLPTGYKRNCKNGDQFKPGERINLWEVV